MKVHNILATKKGHLITVQMNEPVRRAIAILVEHRIGALIVLDDAGKLVGILSERDISRRRFAVFEHDASRPVVDDIDTLHFCLEMEFHPGIARQLHERLDDAVHATLRITLRQRRAHLPLFASRGDAATK